MVGKPSRGYDAGKKINGRKRHIAVDTIGLLLTVLITAASVQDRDGAKPLLWNPRKAFPSVKLTWADGGYACKLVTWAKTKLRPKLALEIVKRPDDLHTFQVLPRRDRADPGVDHPLPPHRPRLRTPASAPRNHGHLCDDHHLTRRLARRWPAVQSSTILVGAALPQ
jgi:hypothetical protein